MCDSETNGVTSESLAHLSFTHLVIGLISEKLFVNCWGALANRKQNVNYRLSRLDQTLETLAAGTPQLEVIGETLSVIQRTADIFPSCVNRYKETKYTVLTGRFGPDNSSVWHSQRGQISVVSPLQCSLHRFKPTFTASSQHVRIGHYTFLASVKKWIPPCTPL